MKELKQLPRILFAAILLFSLILFPKTIGTVETEVTLPAGWRLITLPVDPDEKLDPCELFGPGKVVGVDGTEYVDCSEIGEWEAGRGFWVYLEKDTTVRVAGKALSADDAYSISLKPGWNQVGTPYNFSISVDQSLYVDGIPFKSSSIIRPGVYGYDTDSDSYYEANYLYPWEGYLMYALRNTDLLIIPVEGEGEQGPAVTLRITDAMGPGGQTVDLLDLDQTESVTLWAAGYDVNNRFTGNVVVEWSTTGDLYIGEQEPSDHITFTPASGDTGGRVAASVNTMSDTTGTIVVLGSGELYAYPFNSNTELAEDETTGVGYISNQVLVTVASGTSDEAARAAIEAAGGRVVGRNAAAGIYQVKIPDGSNASSFAQSLDAPEITSASLNYVFTHGSLPADPAFDASAPDANKWAYEKLNLDSVWGAVSPTGAPLVAIVDSGIDASHPDLAGRITAGRNFLDPANENDVADSSGHGTAVAGLIAAVPDNGIGTAGFCFTCNILPLKVCDSSGYCPAFHVAAAMTYAADSGAKIINMSIGAVLPADSTTATVLASAAQYAESAGALVIAAAGNKAADFSSFYPAALDGVFSVSATDDADARAAFSNFGDAIDVSAPGMQVYTTIPGSYALLDGTSMSAAVASGLAGLALSLEETMTPAETAAMLRDSAVALATDKPVGPRLDAQAMVTLLASSNGSPYISSITIDKVVLPGASVPVSVDATDPDGDPLEISWSVDAGTITPDGDDSATWTLPGNRGNYTVTVTVTDPLGATAQAEALTLAIDELIQISVSPDGVSVSEGDTVQYSALCYDDRALNGIKPPVACEVQWGVQGTLGFFNTSGLFTATTAGTGNIVGSFAGISGFAGITVTDSGSGGGLSIVTDTTPCTNIWPLNQCNTAGTHQSTLKLVPPLTIRDDYKYPGAVVPGSGQSPTFQSGAVAKDGIFIVGHNYGGLYKIYQSTMTLAPGWPVDLSEGTPENAQIMGSPVFDPTFQYVFVAVENGYIFKVDVTTDPGTIVWKWTPSATQESSFFNGVSISGDKIYAATTTDKGETQRGRIYCIQDNGASASTAWSYPPAANTSLWRFLSSTPSVFSVGGVNMVTAGNVIGEIYIVNADTGALIHKINVGGSAVSKPVVVNNYVYYTSMDGYFRKIDPTPVTGGIVWEAPISSSLGQPAYENSIFYVPTMNGELFAIKDNGADYDDTVWAQPADLESTRVDAAPVLYEGGGAIDGGGTAPAGLLVVTYNSAYVMAVKKSDGSRILGYDGNPWKFKTTNMFHSPIILEYGAEVEAYLGMQTDRFVALQRNFAPKITNFALDEQPTNNVPMIPGATTSATATVFVYDKNGFQDVDRVVLDLTSLRGVAELELNVNAFTVFHNRPVVTYPITVPAGFPAGPVTLTATVYDLSGASGQATADLDIADTPPTIISVEFNPAYVFPNNSDTTTATVVVEDLNIVAGQANADPVITMDIDPIRGNTGTPNIITLTCGDGYTTAGKQRATCTASGITGAIGTPPGSYTLTAFASDTINLVTGTGVLDIIGADTYTLIADPTDPTAGDFATITVTASNSTYGTIANYVNDTAISITINGGTAGTISYTGSGITDNIDGTATMATGTFSSGQAKFKIRNTTAETLTVTMTDANGIAGTSGNIEWVARILDSFDVTWTYLELVKGDNADIQITALDEFGNTVKIYNNPNGLLISHASGASDPTDLIYTHTTPSVVSDNNDGTADFATGSFTNGVASFKVTSSNAYTNVIFDVDEKTTSITGTSNGVEWLAGVLGYFTLEQVSPVPPGNPVTGATATIRITAYDNSSFPQVLTIYNNSEDITLGKTSGTGATMVWAGTGVTNTGNGLALLTGVNNGGGHFVNGVAEIEISNTTAETATLSVTEADRTPAISKTIDVTWEPGPIDYFDVYITPAQTNVTVGTTITATLTAKDKYGFTSTSYKNVSGVTLVQSVGAAGTGFTWAGTDVVAQPSNNAVITGNGTAFTSGVGTFTITDVEVNRGVTITVTDVATGKTGSSVPISWNPGPLNYFEIIASPTSLITGENTTVTITAYDSFGNIKDDFASNTSLSITNGTAASLTWSGAGVSGVNGTGTLLGSRYSSGVATASLRDTKPEGPVLMNAVFTTVSSQSDPADSPTWAVGPLAKITIRDAANNGGSAVGDVTMPVGQTLSMWAAGYDQFNNYISDISADWSATGTLDAVTPGPATTIDFVPITPFTDGVITAASGAISDDTGNIHVESGKPNAPTLYAQGDVDQVLVSWDKPTKYVDGLPIVGPLYYRLYRSETAGGPWSQADVPYYESATDEITFIDTGVVRWTDYYYIIYAVNPAVANTYSDFSNEVMAAPIGPKFNYEKSCAVQDTQVYHPPDYDGYINRPRDMAMDGTYAYVSDTDNHRISVFLESDCSFVPPIWGEFGFATGQFKYPDGIVYSGGSVYVADDIDRFQEFDTSGNVVTQHTTVSRARKMVQDGMGNLYVTSATNMVYKVSMTTGVVDESGSFAATSPTGIDFHDGLLYVGDSISNVVRVFDTSGNEVNTIGEPGNRYGQLNNPQGVIVDSVGYIYVADTDNHRVQVFDQAGAVVNAIGGFGYGNGLLRYPEGVAFSPATGNLWIVDTRNQQISEFSPPAP